LAEPIAPAGRVSPAKRVSGVAQPAARTPTVPSVGRAAEPPAAGPGLDAAEVLDLEEAVEEVDEAAESFAAETSAPTARPARRRRIRLAEDEDAEDDAEGAEDDDLLYEGATGLRPKKKRKRRTPDELARLRRRKRRRLRRERPRVSPPLQATDPMSAYLAGEMVPCPVGCGGFSEVVRVGSRDDGSGEVWFECLSCAQRRMFEVAPPSPEETRAVFRALDQGREPTNPRLARPVLLRRRGRQLVCAATGIVFTPPD
jgi:hypothetical protein